MINENNPTPKSYNIKKIFVVESGSCNDLRAVVENGVHAYNILIKDG